MGSFAVRNTKYGKDFYIRKDSKSSWSGEWYCSGEKNRPIKLFESFEEADAARNPNSDCYGEREVVSVRWDVRCPFDSDSNESFDNPDSAKEFQKKMNNDRSCKTEANPTGFHKIVRIVKRVRQ